MNNKWMKEYFDLYKKPLFDEEVIEKLLRLKNEMELTNRGKNKIMIMGNGGSAAMASHVAVDFSKNAKIRMVNFNEPDLITCLSNDYGYEYWMSKAIGMYGDSGDMVILISSSGSSPNVIKAAKESQKMGLKVVTFTGFNESNSLKQLGEINFWVDSRAYNVIEMIHHIWLLAICDSVIGKAEYPAN